ncbi:dTDP-4-dehydrorhamnose 3,5-epimerase [Agarivorans sp. JK6]|uniref:dTDP-4-dehydrorhamnose 3,5-epimerase n=1 Tax=Agarivorans sp. JK6 TaxID=2997426 RepID=UPI003872E087
MIKGVAVTKLKQIGNEKGDVYHALKYSDGQFHGFGEAYFSHVLPNEIKGWKKHSEMVLNLIVPVGKIKFVVFDDRPTSDSCGEFFEIVLGPNNYYRLTIAKDLWVAFQGVESGDNILLNIANIEHDPNESTNKELSEIGYIWE